MDGLVENAGPARGEERSGLEARTEEGCTPCPPRSRNAVGGATATTFNEEGERCQCQCQIVDATSTYLYGGLGHGKLGKGSGVKTVSWVVVFEFMTTARSDPVETAASRHII